MTAKDLVVKPIASSDANRLIKRLHYSGKVVNNSKLHFGVFYEGHCEGVMSFGPSIDKRRVMPLVKGTKWNEFMELNRLAFSDILPRNSESRALAIAFRLIKKHYPHIRWIVSYADATQCGDGTIYRASGFILTGITKNKTILRAPNGDIVADVTINTSRTKTYKGYKKSECTPLQGYQVRYIRFLYPEDKKKLTVKELPFSTLKELGVSMYKGAKRELVEGQEDPPVDKRFDSDSHAPTLGVSNG